MALTFTKVTMSTEAASSGSEPTGPCLKMSNVVTIRAEKQKIRMLWVTGVAVKMVDLNYLWNAIKAAVLALCAAQRDESLSLPPAVRRWFLGRGTSPCHTSTLHGAMPEASRTSSLPVRRNLKVLSANGTNSFDRLAIFPCFSSVLVKARSVAILCWSVARSFECVSAWAVNFYLWRKVAFLCQGLRTRRSRSRIPVALNGAKSPTSTSGEKVVSAAFTLLPLWRSHSVPRKTAVPNVWWHWLFASTTAKPRTCFLFFSVCPRAFPKLKVALLSIFEHGLCLRVWRTLGSSWLSFSCSNCIML